ncbi:MAG: glucans biosynthesis glucosyltransferase MdoH [Desulfobacterota bacterium]|nr:glucans biosynthesis glucosyltransferase MdoH [Thermodesulfobacteriota bacterium]
MNLPSLDKPWENTARLRRLLLLALIIASSVIASGHMADILPHRGSTRLEFVIVIVFATLFAWISIGFWEAMAGLWTLARRVDRFSITLGVEEDRPLEGTGARTAILIPVANEDPERVFAGIRATYQSLEDTGQVQHFDFFILSDSSDPDRWVEEEMAWAETCRSLRAFNRIFYRRRRVNLKRKSGNIADFCRRWGKSYRYMIVFDADSVMAGNTLVRMVHAMERHPKVGILQTAPLAVNRETLIARTQQFANHVYSSMFAAGLHYIQLGDSHFWGHNAIIRVEPFMQHCGLPELPGKPPRGGFIMSHDFVEAAFMRRGGWEVWLAYDLGGSYEEVPPTLLEELKRDRRWCQGNLQHIRIAFARGLLSAHRALFLHGAMSYGSSLLWFVFISLSTAAAFTEAFRTPVYFPEGRTLFPDWPVWHPQWALTLLGTTAVILFMPKLFSVILILLKSGKARQYGGRLKLLASLVLEVLLSALFAPVRMLFHSKFVFITLLGRQVGWGPQQRSDLGTGWREAIRFHGPGTLLALLWAAALFFINRSFFWWNAPIFIPLILSIPLSVWSSRASVGRIFRRLGLLLIPEEIERPKELQSLEATLASQQKTFASSPRAGGFVKAIINPVVNAVHLGLLRGKRSRWTPAIASGRAGLIEKAFSQGPRALSPKEKRIILYDPLLLQELHRRVWETADEGIARLWGIIR